MRTIIFILFLVMLTGCAVFNPYNDDFTCPKTFNGKCVSPKQAYRESLENTPGEDQEAIKPLKDLKEDLNLKGSAIEATYQNALFEKLTALLKEPATPMIAPPQIVRVLILPYKGEGAKLFMPRYVYLIIDEPKWVLGNLLGEEKPARAAALPAK
ncbi:MAG: type IV conjugative transfer system protein TraV [Candidatus Manganitrophaceae bacterium]|nr:MAG: type IV conjugative transfer system protein TraV [Candidatus Manganitrophaceae bacterium]